MAPTFGTKLGPFEVVEPLGTGGGMRCIALAIRDSGAMWPSRSCLY